MFGCLSFQIDNVDENVPKQSPQIQSMTNTDTGHEDRRKGNSFVKVCALMSSICILDLIEPYYSLAYNALRFYRLTLRAKKKAPYLPHLSSYVKFALNIWLCMSYVTFP